MCFYFFTFFERILYKSNCIIFIFSLCGTHTKIRSQLVVIVTAGSQKITLWGPQTTPLGILRVNWHHMSDSVSNLLLCLYLVRSRSEMLPHSAVLKQKAAPLVQLAMQFLDIHLQAATKIQKPGRCESDF